MNVETQPLQSFESRASEEEHLARAVAMSEWFPDYLFGVLEEPRQLPTLTIERLVRQFGDLNHTENLRKVCDELSFFEGDIQPDIAAYICGFPEADLDAMSNYGYKEVCALLDRHFPPKMDDEIPELAWQDGALCAQTDPELFFPEKGGSTRNAKTICFDCETTVACLIYALKNDERHGIWGGLSERERRPLVKKINNFPEHQRQEAREAIAKAAVETVLHKKSSKRNKKQQPAGANVAREAS